MQTSPVAGFASSPVATLAALPTTGNVLLAAVARQANGGMVAPSGGGVATWTQLAVRNSGSNSSVALYYGVVGAVPSASVTFAATSAYIAVTELSLLNRGAGGNTASNSTIGGTAPVTAGPILGSVKGLFFCAAHGATSTTTPAGFTTLASITQFRLTYLRNPGATVSVSPTLSGACSIILADLS